MKEIRSDHAPDFFAHAYDHCESRQSASSRGRLHEMLFYGNGQKNSKPPFKGDLLPVSHCGLLLACKYF